MKKKLLSMNIASIVSAAALTVGIPTHVHAQTSGEEVRLENVSVTGSLIKRSEETNALPIQIITSLDIAKTGVSTAAELIAKLPAMQGLTTPGASVGGGGGGIQTANLRGIGSQYTLVLLNGRRMAPATAGGTIDLSTIPISAIERVEVLTDGASALYGSDAIAGVVNFILKKNVQSTTISGRVDRPQESGGASRSFDLTTGFGDFDTDGFNIMLSLSHEKQESLAASERDFAKTGIITFTHPSYDQEALFFNGSGNSVPGNALVYYTADDAELDEAGNLPESTLAFSPYQSSNGECPTQTSPIGTQCFFDYTSTIQILPENERNSLFLQGDFKINDNLKAFTSFLYSENDVVSRIAPYPTGFIRLYDADTDTTIADLVADEVYPHLSDLGLSQTEIDSISAVDGRWRALAANNRSTEYNATAIHFVAGLEGTTGLIDYNVSLTHAESEREQNYPTGWLLQEEFVNAVTAGSINIFAGQDKFADQAALAETVYSGHWDTTDTTMTMFAAQAVAPLFQMAGGAAQIATGIDYRTTSYAVSISEANAGEALLDLGVSTPYDLERSQYGAFAEVLLPISSTIELNASLRYDNIGAVADSLNGGDINDSDSDLTYKINGVWDVANKLKLRASYGTGFKAPGLLEIGRPLSDFGVTAGTFECPFESTDALAATCSPGLAQYDVFNQGNPNLSPETSTQYTAGFVFTPTDTSSIIVDYWNIELTNLVQAITESQIFNNPETYRDLFTTSVNASTGEEELGIILAAQNAGKSKNSGIDYSFNNSYDLGFGDLSTTVGGTYMIESESSLTGSSLGRFGEDDAVVFRNLINASASLTHGNFSETLSLNYRSGYIDQAQSVTLLEDDGSFGDGVDVQLSVPSYATLDLVLTYSMLSDRLLTTFGINNITDKEPPLSLRVSGAGHQVGWDPRYADAFGRTFYLSASYEF